MEGWIKMYRSIVAWEWFDCSEMVHIFIYLLASANYDERNWHGESIHKGQIITTVGRISSVTKISIQKIRTCLKRLEDTGEIKVKSTNKYTIITICNYERYQNDFESYNKQITNEQQTNNNQLTTLKEIKEINNNISTTSNVRACEEEQDLDVYVGLEDVKNRLLQSGESWRESVSLECYRLNGKAITDTELDGMIEDFVNHLKSSGYSMKKVRDIQRHFMNWIRVRIKIEKNDKSKKDEKPDRPSKQERDSEIADLMARKLSAIGSY